MNGNELFQCAVPSRSIQRELGQYETPAWAAEAVIERIGLNSGRKQSVWRAAVMEALQELGGQAKLQQLYAAMAPRRPTGNPWWKEQVRKVLQTYSDFVSKDGVWQLHLKAAI